MLWIESMLTRAAALMPIFQAIIQSPLGHIQIRTNQQHLLKLEFVEPCQLIAPQTELIERLVSQLKQYFADPQLNFNQLWLNLSSTHQGTDFQNRVWQALTEIPLGQVLTYGQLAKKLNTSARAIGNACRHNPTPIIVPCHRIVSATGLGGFAGQTQGRLTEVKTWLLKHEGIIYDQ
jgi:methylated-DNA-[protein]-cysteine S-methyltransferase